MNTESVATAPLSRLFVLFLVAVVMVCPGALWLAMFTSSTFHSTETNKLLMLAAAISLPVFLTNIAAGMLVWMAEFWDLRHPDVIAQSEAGDTTPDNAEGMLETALVIGGIFSFIPLYVPLLIRFFARGYSLKAAVITLLLLESFGFFVLAYAAWRLGTRRFREARKEVDRLRAEGKIKPVSD